MNASSLLLGTSVLLLLSSCAMRDKHPEAYTEPESVALPAPASQATPTPDAAPAEPVARRFEEASAGRARAADKEAPAMERKVEVAMSPPPPPRPVAGTLGMGAVGAGGLSTPAKSSSGPGRPSEIDEDGTFRGSQGGDRFQDHGVNPFTMVADDALSTFGMDVDTAAYSVVRKMLVQGRLPPTAAPRVEEFINYFDYDYASPTDGGPFAVHMAAMPDPFREGRHILSVGIQAREIPREEREPVHLTFLVDVSGSMESTDKLPLARQSLHLLVDNLDERDTVALATYAGSVQRVLEPTSAVNKRQIHDAIERLRAGGSTAMSSGIDLAYELAWQGFVAGHENRVIILSDGDANVGKTSWDELLSQVKGYADKGVTLTTVGFGMGNYNDTLMQQLSNKGDGNNVYIDDEEQARRVFVEKFGGSMITVARDAKIQVEFNPESVVAWRLLGYENRDIADKDFRNDRVDAGEVGAGQNVTALYEVILREGYSRDLATVRLRWEAPGADVGHGGRGAVEKSVRFPDRALAETVEQASRELRIAYAAATFAEILRQSHEASEISLDALIAFASKARRPGQADDVELVKMMERARSLGAGSPSGRVTRR